jgi:hypothetical protein
MKNLYTTLFILGLFAVTFSCTDLEEELRGVITTNISVEKNQKQRKNIKMVKIWKHW